MSTPHNWFRATNADGRDMAPDLLKFAEMIGLERVASADIAFCFYFVSSAERAQAGLIPPKYSMKSSAWKESARGAI